MMTEICEPTATSLSDGFARDFDLGELSSLWPDAAMRTDDLRIRVATTAEQLHAISRLRYDLYIARDGKKYDRARHISRTFVEPIDRKSLNFYAAINSGVVGAARLVKAKDALNDPHLKLLVQAAQPEDLDKAVVNSRFVVLPEMRARSLIEPMFEQIYRCGFISGANEYLLASRGELSPLFLKFGFQPTGRTFFDPVAGVMSVLVFNSHDLSHRRFAQHYVERIEASCSVTTLNVRTMA